MATHTIVLDPLSLSSITQAARRVREIRIEVERKRKEYVERIALLGVETAKAAFGNGVSVQAIPFANGFKVAANGEAVAFLEFGAGTATDSGNMFASQMPFEVSEGSWSRSPEGSGQFASLGKWEFPKGSGNWMEYVAPRGGMQKAYEAIVRDAHKIAREVFK